MYNASIVTEKGTAFSFGVDSGTVFDIEPLSGITVTVKTSQGYTQIGTTVEGMSVGGITRTIQGAFIGSDEQCRETARSMISALPALTSARLHYNNTHYTDCVISKTPNIVRRGDGTWVFSLEVYCAEAFWKLEDTEEVTFNAWEASFRFPVVYDTHVYGTRSTDTFVTFANPGSTPVYYKATFTCDSPVSNVGLMDTSTGKQMRLQSFDMGVGDVLEIYRENGRLRATLTDSTGTHDAFGKIADDSELFMVQPGENVWKLLAASNVGNLYCTITFSPAVMGVVDGA